MAVSQISISFKGLFVIDDGNFWGPGEWQFTATVDGQSLGDPNGSFEAHTKHWILLDPDAWSTLLNVEDKGPGSTVEIRFEAQTADGKDLGKVSALLKFPFKQELDLNLAASKTGGGVFSSAHSRYSLNLGVKIVQERITNSLPDKANLYVNRQANGTESFSTVSGTSLAPRVEICPVVPVPPARSLPPRPKFPAGFAAGKSTPQAARVELTGAPLNALPNPAVIPALDASDSEITSKAARIAVTYFEPGNLQTDSFSWSVKCGPVAFFGDTDGQMQVLAYGTGNLTVDQEAIIELRWGQGGPLLSTFRAVAGKVKEISFRATVVNPSTQTIRTGPADVSGHIAIANVLLWQAGLKLVADRDDRRFDGVTLEDDGIFSLTLPQKLNKWSIGVDTDAFPRAALINFRPGVLNIVYIKSTANESAAETDRALLDGADESDSGSPSTSWVQPSGVPPDGGAGSVTMHTSGNTGRTPKVFVFPVDSLTNADVELKYLKKRVLPYNAMTQLFALVIPDYSSVGPSDPDYGATLAHLTCRVLGLLDRGISFDDSGSAASEDGINLPNGVGYPFWENLMCTGVFQWSQDLDVIQAKALRNHALVNPPLPALDDPPFAAGFDQSRYPGDDKMKVWSLASPYSFACYYLDAPNHPHGWTGNRATLEQQGWKTLPTYFGQQPAGTAHCAHNELTADQGNTDGTDAADKMATEGFDAGTYVFLDVEHQDNMPQEMLDYIGAWVSSVASSAYAPGIYCARRNADDIKGAVDQALVNSPGTNVRYWIVGGGGFTVDSDPTGVGRDFAIIWQNPIFEIQDTHGKVQLTLDQNVASRADPAGP